MATFFIAGFLGGVIIGRVTFISGLIGLVSAWIIFDLGLTFKEVASLSPAIAL